MNNNLFLIGRLIRSEVKENYGTFTLAVQREYKNKDGVYDTDFIYCKCFSFTAEYLNEYCNKGDLLAVKGRLQTNTYEDKTTLEVIVEKITRLAQKQGNRETNKGFEGNSIKQEEIVINDLELPF